MVMGLSMMVIGSLVQAQSTGAVGLVAICCYLAGLGMSFGPIVWILMSEIFPSSIRGQAMSIAIAAQWSANFVVCATFPVMFGDSTLNGLTHGGFAFWLYGGFAILAAFVVLRYVPETKGIDHERLGGFWKRQALPDAIPLKP
jgi:SP family xylose:H+ symportor-like MFS transporter